MLAVALALASSVSWGAADFAAGLKSRRLAVGCVLLLSSAASLPVVGFVVALRGVPPPPASEFVLPAVLASASGTVGIAAFYRALAVGTMSVVAPISATAAVVPVTVGVALGERPSLVQALGAGLALVGVVLASREAAGSAAGGRGRLTAGAGLALVAALGFGGFFVGIDVASEQDAMWAILAQRSTTLLLVLGAVAVTRPSLAVGRADLLGLAVIGLLDTAANALFALASREGLVALVGILGSLYPVVTILLARAVLSERLAPAQWTGVGIALAGVALISAG